MPRPVASALRRATSGQSPAQPLAPLPTCTCTHPPASRNASTHAAVSACAPPPPPPDAIEPLVTGTGGFGFFSRSLPKRRSPRPLYSASDYAARGTPVSPTQSPSAWILHAPPQFPTTDLPVPSPSSSSSSRRLPSLSAPPPPPPVPQSEPFDVRNWTPANQSTSSSRATASSFSAAPTAAPAAATLVSSSRRARLVVPATAQCVCGRVQMSCLRCRASSSSSAAAAAALSRARPKAYVEDRDGLDTIKSTAEALDPIPKIAERDSETRTSGERKRPSGRRRRPSDPAELPEEASARLAALLHRHAPKSLPNLRGTTVVSSHPQRGSRYLSLAEASASLAALKQEAQDEAFFARLSVHEKLDLVRAVSTIARAVLAFPPTQLLPSTDDVAASPSAEGDERSRFELRHAAAAEMRALLARSGLDKLEAVGESASSKTRSSAALLIVDAATLADDVVQLAESLASKSPAGRSRLATALRTLFAPPPVRANDTISVLEASTRETNRRQNAHVALALVLDTLERNPHSEASDSYSSASTALRLLYDTGAHELLDFVLPSSLAAAQQKQRAHNDVLRRRYGMILGRLEPTPSQWFQKEAFGTEGKSGDRRAGASLGLHLIRYLARAGSAGEAFAVWQALDRGVDVESSSVASELNDLERLEALSHLVDGLAMERLFADANTLAGELEDLARAVQIGGIGEESQGDAAIEPKSTTPSPLVPAAYRALARLASGQGRTPILERLLSRLATVSDGPAASGGQSLEAAARRMRARSRRYEVDEVRAIFDSADLDSALPEERARLWGQLIAAYVRVNDVEGGLRELQNMLSTGLYVPLSTIDVVLHGFARRGDVKRTSELFSRLAEGEFPRLQPSASSWNALLLAHSVAKDPTVVEGLVTEMRLAGCRPNRQTWTTLLSTYVENGQWVPAFRVYRLLQSQSDPAQRPDTAVYNIMLKACILTGTPAKTVVDLFRELIARGIRPNMRTYTLVLQSVCIAGMMDIAEELFLLMDRRQDSPDRPPGMSVIEPDQFVFSTLVAGYLRRGEPAKARAMLHEMTARGIKTSSIAVGVIIAARIDALQQREGRITGSSMQHVIQQARDFLETGTSGEKGGLEGRRRRQPVRFDRPLALGKEAAVVYAPILRSLAKQGNVAASLELFEEILDRQDARGVPPIELYTTVMDAFRQQELEVASPRETDRLARHVHTIWGQLYDSVCDRFVRLRPVEDSRASVGPPLPKFSRRVDPAQIGILRLPFTILLDVASRAGNGALIEETWRRLVQQGFAFDASNWNALALWFTRDLQLEKAMWITEHVLCKPTDDADRDADRLGETFAAELGAAESLTTNGRTPSRVWSQTQAIAAPARTGSLDLSFLSSRAGDGRSEQVEQDRVEVAEAAEPVDRERDQQQKDVSTAFSTGIARQATLAYMPYRRTLETLETALDVFTTSGTLRSEAALTAAASAVADVPGNGLSTLSFEEAQAEYRRLVQAHPHTMRSIEALRARRHRVELDRHERSKGRY
ncbi:hypothetical protein BMF94_5009 [Rhodotorula taiwanensis]|uniref:Pentacotripeptide-repeat region of PRORP domain-containing protein n=1 Tax=Rhodotorula taiwanensis TaxID=741276 RepID=A0A2S5B5E3_9BASI|nr:hypothetical protein BMF94_5009 [Rhodotorula taiwanensis]